MKCIKCKLQIAEKEDRYVLVADFNKGKKIKEVYMHLNCWKNMFSEGIQNALKENVGKVMKMIVGGQKI